MRPVGRVVAGAAAVVLGIPAGVLAGQGDRAAARSGADVGTATVAAVGRPGLTAVDAADDLVRITAREARARGTAVASATCDGCAARAGTVQVVIADRADALGAGNAASSWASCTDCDASAVSVQVVLARDPALVRADNTALAVTAGCSGCRATAAAYQLVVLDPAQRGLSRHTRENLRRVVDELLAATGAGALAAAPDRLADAVHPLPVATVRVDVDRGARRGH